MYRLCLAFATPDSLIKSVGDKARAILCTVIRGKAWLRCTSEDNIVRANNLVRKTVIG